MLSPKGNIGLKKIDNKKGNYIYLLIHLDDMVESSREGNIGWGGGTSTSCMSSVQDLPKERQREKYR